MMGCWEGRGNKYLQLVKVLYCKLLPAENNYQFSHLSQAGNGTSISEVGGESVTTL